jgi:hypothetical protein
VQIECINLLLPCASKARRATPRFMRATHAPDLRYLCHSPGPAAPFRDLARDPCHDPCSRGHPTIARISAFRDRARIYARSVSGGGRSAPSLPASLHLCPRVRPVGALPRTRTRWRSLRLRAPITSRRRGPDAAGDLDRAGVTEAIKVEAAAA